MTPSKAAICAAALAASAAAQQRPPEQMNTQCLLYNGMGCNTIEDKNSCLNSRDGRIFQTIDSRRVRGEPCIWCDGANCGPKLKGCEAYDLVVGNPAVTPQPASFTVANCLDYRSVQESMKRAPSYSEFTSSPALFFPVNGGEGQACRGLSVYDDGRGVNTIAGQEWSYAMWTAPSMEVCKAMCGADCLGVEYNAANNYCETWVDLVSNSGPVTGYQCYTKNQKCLELASTGCSTITDKNACLSSKDGRQSMSFAAGEVGVFESPCAWCGDGRCHDGSSAQCETLSLLIHGHGKAFNTFFSYMNFEIATCWGDASHGTGAKASQAVVRMSTIEDLGSDGKVAAAADTATAAADTATAALTAAPAPAAAVAATAGVAASAMEGASAAADTATAAADSATAALTAAAAAAAAASFAPLEGPIGGSHDEHGCLPGAGYEWCPSSSTCVRGWEEPCVSGTVGCQQFCKENPTAGDSNPTTICRCDGHGIALDSAAATSKAADVDPATAEMGTSGFSEGAATTAADASSIGTAMASASAAAADTAISAATVATAGVAASVLEGASAAADTATAAADTATAALTSAAATATDAATAAADTATSAATAAADRAIAVSAEAPTEAADTGAAAAAAAATAVAGAATAAMATVGLPTASPVGGKFIRAAGSGDGVGSIFWYDALGKHPLSATVDCEQCGCDENVLDVPPEKFNMIPLGDTFHCIAMAPPAAEDLQLSHPLGRFITAKAGTGASPAGTLNSAEGSGVDSIEESNVYWQDPAGEIHPVVKDHSCDCCSQQPEEVDATQILSLSKGRQFTCSMLGTAALPVARAGQVGPATAGSEMAGMGGSEMAGMSGSAVTGTAAGGFSLGVGAIAGILAGVAVACIAGFFVWGRSGKKEPTFRGLCAEVFDRSDEDIENDNGSTSDQDVEAVGTRNVVAPLLAAPMPQMVREVRAAATPSREVQVQHVVHIPAVPVVSTVRTAAPVYVHSMEAAPVASRAVMAAAPVASRAVMAAAPAFPAVVSELPAQRRDVFDLIDNDDHNNVLTREEWEKYAFGAFDANNDGRVSAQEFKDSGCASGQQPQR